MFGIICYDSNEIMKMMSSSEKWLSSCVEGRSHMPMTISKGGRRNECTETMVRTVMARDVVLLILKSRIERGPNKRIEGSSLVPVAILAPFFWECSVIGGRQCLLFLL